MDLHCMKNIHLEAGDTITVVAFNKARPTSTSGQMTRAGPAFKGPGVFEKGLFAQSQHTIVRMDFVSDKARARSEARQQTEAKRSLRARPTTTMASEGALSVDYRDIYTPAALYLNQYRWATSAANMAKSHGSTKEPRKYRLQSMVSK
jgi:hypothetical protein